MIAIGTFLLVLEVVFTSNNSGLKVAVGGGGRTSQRCLIEFQTKGHVHPLKKSILILGEMDVKQKKHHQPPNPKTMNTMFF